MSSAERKIGVSEQGVELGIDAALVTTISQSFARLQRDYQFLLLELALARSLMRDQRVRNLLESRADRFFAGDLCILALSFGQPDVVLQPPGGEDWLRGGTKLQVRAGPENRLARFELWPPMLPVRLISEVLSSGDADIGIVGDQRLIGCANVGSALKQFRRQSGGYVWQRIILVETALSLNASRVLAEQQRYLILSLFDLLLQLRNALSCALDELLGLPDVEQCGDTMRFTMQRQFERFLTCFKLLSEILSSESNR